MGQAFSPHRHDTYAIGLTVSGVHTFSYRGERRHCPAGQCHILHPDETHAGGAGTEHGFSYRILHIDPCLVQHALGGKPLPFIADPVIRLSARHASLIRSIWTAGDPLDEVARVAIAVGIADMLQALAMPGRAAEPPLPLASLARVRDMILENPAVRLSSEKLEGISGLDRWTLARQFRSAFGTSPSGLRTMRQLGQVRSLVARGSGLADAALTAGFADQSHMSRQFKRAYGLTPATWAGLLRASGLVAAPASRFTALA
nr:AraC family transcriptional regulator [Phreatobacter stygius]